MDKPVVAPTTFVCQFLGRVETAAAVGAVHIPQSSRVARAHLALIAELKVALVPFRLFVVEGFFAAALFVVPERLVGCDLDDVEPGFGCLARVVEDDVDLFEAAEAGLWVEVVDDGDDDEVVLEDWRPPSPETISGGLYSQYEEEYD